VVECRAVTLKYVQILRRTNGTDYLGSIHLRSKFSRRAVGSAIDGEQILDYGAGRVLIILVLMLLRDDASSIISYATYLLIGEEF
jgi:hypothetical protein